MTERRLDAPTAARDARAAQVVCTSIRCSHPKRRYSCSSVLRTKKGTVTIPHEDCVYAGVGDLCLACSVAGSKGVGDGVDAGTGAGPGEVAYRFGEAVELVVTIGEGPPVQRRQWRGNR